MFQLVDANTVPATDGGCGCGCGGNGKKARAEQAAAEQAPAPAAQAPAEHGGCGCGGHGAQAPEAPAERPREMAAEPITSTAGGCGCGGHGGGHGKVHAGGAGVIHRPGADELVIHSIPRVVRHAVLFHQPEPLFAHLQDSTQHYRVETLQAGPVDWRYRITRLA